ncbi:MAG: hypothetical protein ACO1QS_20885, partial [Verrucomicrobiota bacterium]
PSRRRLKFKGRSSKFKLWGRWFVEKLDGLNREAVQRFNLFNDLTEAGIYGDGGLSAGGVEKRGIHEESGIDTGFYGP